jgi:radical SAM protein with 4Fe4S-binding SPASM domain
MQLGGIYDTAVRNSMPLFCCLEITTLCNNKCVHCYNSVGETMSFELAREAMDGAKELGVLFLSITGGEPFLHGRMWDILDYAGEQGFAVLLYTNATLIGESDAKKLKELRIYHVDTTLLGGSAETHDRLTRTPGSFARTMNALELLKRYGINVAVKTPVMKENMQELGAIKKMLSDMGIYHMDSPLIFAKDDGGKEPLRYRIDDGQLLEFFSSREVRCVNGDSGARTCHFGRNTFAVRADGNVNPCISVPLKLGNIRQEPLISIWRDSESLRYIRDMTYETIEECGGCSLKNWCFRCEGISFTEERRLFAPSGELCRMARIRKEAENGRAKTGTGKARVH